MHIIFIILVDVHFVFVIIICFRTFVSTVVVALSLTHLLLHNNSKGYRNILLEISTITVSALISGDQSRSGSSEYL